MSVYPVPFRHQTPQSELERQLISDYLREKGYSHQDLRNLPKEQAHTLMVGACQYASLKLAEVESRAQFRQKIKFER
jgi:hypothetical protein